MSRNSKQQTGQTLLEAIVAIGIVTTSIASALTLTTASLSAEQDALAAVTGANLGREAIEAVRVLRDSNWLSGAAWDEGLYQGNASPDYTGVPVFSPDDGDWAIDFQASGLTSDRAKVYRQVVKVGNAEVGLFRQATAQPDQTVFSGYRRLVELHPICVDSLGQFSVIETGKCPVEKAGIRVTATVAWTTAGRNHQTVIQEMMYDWH